MSLKKNILVAVTGGISAYKAVDVISALKKYGHNVRVMATENALKFVTKNTLAITADKYYEDVFDAPVHIDATEDIDAFVIVPATANIIGKIANGIADDLVTSTSMALSKNTKRIMCPAMNSRMWENSILQKNVAFLANSREHIYWSIIDPVEGLLACGTTGIGKLPSTRTIVKEIHKVLKIDPLEP